MNMEELIRSRRSIGKMKPDPIDRSIIERLLAAAVQAPNHYSTHPWRFFVMTGEGRRLLGRAYAEITKEEMEQAGIPVTELLLKKQEEKAFRAPVVIAAAAAPSDDPKVERIEELAAVHAGVQNMLLTAHSLGIAGMWRSGKPMYHPKMKQAFGLREQDSLVGLVYFGYPLQNFVIPPTNTHEDKTTWIEEDISQV